MRIRRIAATGMYCNRTEGMGKTIKFCVWVERIPRIELAMISWWDASAQPGRVPLSVDPIMLLRLQIGLCETTFTEGSKPERLILCSGCIPYVAKLAGQTPR